MPKKYAIDVACSNFMYRISKSYEPVGYRK